MRNSDRKLDPRKLVIACVAVFAIAALPFVSSARLSQSISIVNNSTREIRHVYLSPVDADTWSTNQLGDGVISPGQSVTISDFSCGSQQIKVIGEDQDGCFVSTVVACGTNATWTITNDTAADCGQ